MSGRKGKDADGQDEVKGLIDDVVCCYTSHGPVFLMHRALFSVTCSSCAC
jgi:hypothetical protein